MHLAQAVGARQPVEHLRAAAPLWHLHQHGVEAVRGVGEADEVAPDEVIEQLGAQAVLHPDGLHERGIDRGVAEADAVVPQARGVERAAQHGERLDRPPGRRRADQLTARLEELAHLPAVRAHPAVHVREGGEPERRRDRGITRGGDAGDRDRHVRAQLQDGAVVVEEPVDPRVTADADLAQVVLDGRGVDLPVTEVLKDAPQRVGDRAQLAHLVG